MKALTAMIILIIGAIFGGGAVAVATPDPAAPDDVVASAVYAVEEICGGAELNAHLSRVIDAAEGDAARWPDELAAVGFTVKPEGGARMKCS